MRKEKTKEDAVSPVIGVMLLLVVTVVIAAVVVGFSTGLAGSTETTPTALFEVEFLQMSDIGPYGMPEFNNVLANFGIKHKGGDPIALKDIQITLEQRGGTDGVIQTIQATNDNWDTINPMFEDMMNTGGYTFPLMVLGKGNPDSWDVISGVTLQTGDVLRVVYWDGRDSTVLLRSGTTVKWTLSYIPTTSILAKGEFEVPYP